MCDSFFVVVHVLYFASEYEPTVFETYKVKVPMFREVPVEIWDMSGNPKYDRKRPVVYPNINCFLVCFDLTSRSSWEAVKKKWVPEARGFPDHPLFVAGCKFDNINAHNAQFCVTGQEVQKYLDVHCTMFKCTKFFSVSAKNGLNVSELFKAIVYCTLSEIKSKLGTIVK